MINANRVRIICNPFKKEIEYQWYDFNISEYTEFDPKESKLANGELVHATIQNRAYEIVSTINEECSVGNNGLEIVFIGTEDDYKDLCNVIKLYYSKSNIECVRDTCYYNTADSVMPKIKEKFSEVRKMIEEYSEPDIKQLIDKYNDAIKPQISLCVVGLYSAGKSAFINSIIGSEILPSASDPTTARVCKICCGQQYQIKFWFDGKECILTFEGSNYKSNSNCDKEIIRELQEILKTDTHHAEAFYMNKALKKLNSYPNIEHEISDIIEIKIPFAKTSLPTDKFDFIIYDTPGSNSDNNIRHFEVLKKSLDEQTNALPILVTTPDTMDAEDNGKILKLVEETGAALDTTNTIVIVNRADEKGKGTLEEKKDKCHDLKITKWKSTRIFFLSSIIALASKKDNPDDINEWLDKDMYEIYEEKEKKYTSDERMLFKYNIIDTSKTNTSVKHPDKKKSAHLYINSGLEFIEKEINEYACKYALYNKCQQASAYLQEAVDLCVENIKEAKNRLKEKLNNVTGCFDSKKKNLCDALEKKEDDCKIYNTEFQQLMERVCLEFTKGQKLQDTSENRKSMQKKLQDHWDHLKKTGRQEKKQETWSFSQIQKFVDEKFNELLLTFSKEANSEIDVFWSEKTDQFKESCKDIVHGSSALTEEQKKILDSVVMSQENMFMSHMDFDLRRIGVIRHKKIGFIKLKGEKFDAKLCCEKLIKRFNDAVRTRIMSVEAENEKKFKEWTENLVIEIKRELCKFNKELEKYEHSIEITKNDINSKKECECKLLECKKYIDELLDMQGGTEF